MSLEPRCNGFRIRALNADCDRVAIQSSEQTTWLLGRGSKTRGPRGKWHEVGLARNELMVIRCYGGTPAYEIEPLGDAAGVLIANRSRAGSRTLRVGSRARFDLEPDESVVLRCEHLVTPIGAEIPA